MNGAEKGSGKRAEGAGVPLLGNLVAAAAVALMAFVSWTAWPDLPETVLSGRTNLDGTPDTVPRTVLVLVLPLTAVAMAVTLSVGPVLGSRLQQALGLPEVVSARGTARSVNVLLCLLSPCLLVVHALLVLGRAG